MDSAVEPIARQRQAGRREQPDVPVAVDALRAPVVAQTIALQDVAVGSLCMHATGHDDAFIGARQRGLRRIGDRRAARAVMKDDVRPVEGSARRPLRRRRPLE